LSETVIGSTAPASIVVADGGEGLVIEVVGRSLAYEDALALQDVLWAASESRMPDDITVDLSQVQRVDWSAVAVLTAVGHRLTVFGHRLVLEISYPEPRALFAVADRCGAVVLIPARPGRRDGETDGISVVTSRQVSELWLG
jgi:ABC-type transporter Mla MlaB component